MSISITQMPVFFAVKDLLAYSLLLIFSVVVVSTVDLEVIVRGVAIAAFLILILTTLYLIFIPEVAYEESGPLKGAFYGSNSLPLSLLFASPAIISIKLKSKRTETLLKTLVLLWILVLIVLSTSRTSLVVFVLMLVFWALISIFKKSKKTGVISVLISIGFLVGVSFNWTTITAALGKNPDLSGRFPLWQAYLQAIFERPILGYGWHVRTTPDMALGDYILRSTGYPQINANNDLINWWALTGVAGFALIIATLIYLFVNSLISISITPFSNWLLISAFVLFVAGFTELSTMHPDGWLVLCLAFTFAGKKVIGNQSQLVEMAKTGVFKLP
jgi:O-antigen ligase